MRETGQNKGIFKIIVICLVAVFLFSSVLLGISVWEKHQGKYADDEEFDTSVEYNGTVYEKKENIETFLVMGLDKFDADIKADSYNNDYQADFLMLFVFDNNNRKCSAIHINRDTMAQINILGVAGQKVGSVIKQIALAHSYGNGKEVSCRNTADAVSDLLLGVQINHYVSLTMDSVPKINDLVGGVQVTVLDDFTGVDDSLIKGQTVTLTGQQALHYVRTRYGLEDSTNSTRMQRQRQYIDALQKKFLQKVEENEQFLIDASIELDGCIVSDRSITQLQDLTKKFSEFSFDGIKTVEGKNVRGDKFIEFYPNEDSIEQTVIDLFYVQQN